MNDFEGTLFGNDYFVVPRFRVCPIVELMLLAHELYMFGVI